MTAIALGCKRPDSRSHPASGHSIAVLVLLRSQPAGAGPVSGRTAALFSLLRRYRAGTLWTSSLICRFQKKMAILKTRQNFRSRLGIGFVLYLAINTALISLALVFLGPRVCKFIRCLPADRSDCAGISAV
ncbi:MAG: hypothetical protein ACLR8P_22280 [Clostridium fessum]